MSGPIFESKVRVTDEPSARMTVGALLLLFPAIFVLRGLPEGLAWTLMWSGLFVVAAFWAYVASRALWMRRRFGHDEVLVRAENGALVVGGRTHFRRVATAYLQPKPTHPANVRVKGGALDAVDVAVADDASARELLRALGIDPERSIARFRVHQGMFANKGAQTVVSLVAGFGAIQVLNVLPAVYRPVGFVLVALLTLLNLAPSTVLVGPDGVLVRSWTRFRRKFVPFAEIESAASSQWGVTLVMKSGKTIELRTNNQPRSNDETREALLTRIRAGIAALASREGAADVAALVARAGRPLGEWMSALAALARPNAGYRAAAVPVETLWRVVEDPAADPTARVGAAAALRESLDDAGRARLAAVAENSVHPRVRVAFDALSAAADDGAVREALDGWDTEEEATAEANRPRGG